MGTYYIPLESSCCANSESHKNHGLKIKSSRDIQVWNWSRDVTWPIWNQNISRRFHFQTQFLMWFWIHVTLAFEWCIIWPPFVKKNFFLLTWWWRGDDIHVKEKKNIFFTKRGHIIYRWKASITLIQNHIRTWVWKWNSQNIFWFQIGHVTSCDQFQTWISLENSIFRPWFLCDSESAQPELSNGI